MAKPLSVLMIEDTESDAELTIRLLKRADYELVYEQVETAAQMRAALEKQDWDIIISDFSLPNFDGLAALKLLQATGKDIPFIIVSGTIGEETAVDMMKAGAHDYVMKDKLGRLPPAVEREVEQAKVRRMQKLEEIQLQHHRDDLELINTLNHLVNKGENFDTVVNTLAKETRRLLNAADCAIYLLSPDGKIITLFNRTLDTGRISKIEQLIGRPIPAIQIPVREGSYFNEILNAEHGMITSDPKLIQKWMLEFSETTWLPGLVRKAVRKVIPQIFGLLDIGSTITVPLISEGKCIGILDLSSQGLFTTEDLERVHKISGQVTAAILRMQTVQALRESEQKYQGLTEVSPVGIFQTDAEGAVTYFNARWSQITGMPIESGMGDGWLDSVLPEDREKLIKTWKKAVRSKTASSGEYRTMRPDGRIVWIWYQAIPEKDAEGRVNSYVGTITDISEIKQAQQQVETQLRRMEALNEIDAAINTSLELGNVLDVLLTQTTKQLSVDAAAVLLLDSTGKFLDYAAGSGFKTNRVRSAHLKLDESFAGHILLERKPFHTNDFTSTNAGMLIEAFRKEEEFVAYCGVPLIVKGQVKGVLEVFNRTPFGVSPEWLGFLTTLAEQAAIAIENARMFEILQKSNQELSEAYDATIEGWSRALDLRDKETEGHTQRVTQMADRMAAALGMSSAERLHVRRGALLHDIGKLGVPDAILLKPEALSEDEWVLMRKHPQFAYDMLAPITYLRQALDIPHYHHEKWDGSGYPTGLKGEAIPLAARMFAVIDMWDALLSDRPYRAGWPITKVISHIRSLSGTHFDPRVVEVFLYVIRGMDGI